MDNCLTAKLIGSELPTTLKAGDLTEKKKKKTKKKKSMSMKVKTINRPI